MATPERIRLVDHPDRETYVVTAVRCRLYFPYTDREQEDIVLFRVPVVDEAVETADHRYWTVRTVIHGYQRAPLLECDEIPG